MNVAYLDGIKVSPNNQISLYNPSFLYGINCFEGIRAYWNDKHCKLHFFDLNEHLDRLYSSADALDFKELPIDKLGLAKHIYDIINLENIKENIYVRVTFFLGEDTSWSDELNVRVLVSIRSMNSELNNSKPLSVGISSFKRISDKSMPPYVKAGANYLNSRYALLEAKRKGYDGAIFMSDKECISESTGSCIFFIKDNTLYTPSVTCDILVGITRNRIIALCKNNGINVIESEIVSSDLPSFDAAFLAGTMIEIKPIQRIEQFNYNTENSLYKMITQKLSDYLYEMEL